jgi:hypothetical protein
MTAKNCPVCGCCKMWNDSDGEPCTEADARLGKAVRDAVGNISVDSLEQTLREEYEGRGPGVFPRVLLLAVTRALRAEVSR